MPLHSHRVCRRIPPLMPSRPSRRGSGPEFNFRDREPRLIGERLIEGVALLALADNSIRWEET